MTKTLNKSNFGNCEFGVSAMKTAKSGNKFYWVLIYPQVGDVMYCATSESLTTIMGENCSDEKFCTEILPAIQDKFEVANITDEETKMDAVFEDGTPIYCIRKRAHRMAAAW